jgi:hypothetical protein
MRREQQQCVSKKLAAGTSARSKRPQRAFGDDGGDAPG